MPNGTCTRHCKGPIHQRRYRRGESWAAVRNDARHCLRTGGNGACRAGRNAKGTIAGRWRGESVVCIASGPSLHADDVRRVGAAGVRRIVVNDCWRLAPDADILYAADGQWWDAHAAKARAAFQGECWTRDVHAAARYGLNWIESQPEAGLSRLPYRIHEGGNSGYQAINLAFLAGARRILLLGYDMQRTGGLSHWFGDHPGRLQMPSPYDAWCAMYDRLADDLSAEGIEVVNCSRATALTCFARRPLAEVL